MSVTRAGVRLGGSQRHAGIDSRRAMPPAGALCQSPLFQRPLRRLFLTPGRPVPGILSPDRVIFLGPGPLRRGGDG
jgi:hypothetical protein